MTRYGHGRVLLIGTFAIAVLALTACGGSATSSAPAELSSGAPAAASAAATSAAPASSAAAAPSAAAASSAAASPSVDATLDTTSHDNVVTFDDKDSKYVETFSFSMDPGDFAVSSGQPWGGVNGCNGATSKCDVHVQAGRHNSSMPAEFFKGNTTARICTGPDATASACHGPEELNFSLLGTLTIETNPGDALTYTVGLGQGSDGAGVNNWWLGGVGDGWTTYYDGDADYLVTPDHRYRIKSADDDSNFHVLSPDN